MNFKSIKNGLLAMATVFTSVNMYYSQAAQAGRLYLSSAATGRIYDITAVANGTATGNQAISGFVVSGFGDSGGANNDRSSLAVGFDSSAPGTGPFYFFSNTGNGNTLYKNNITGGNVGAAPAGFGGISTNNTPGTYLGVTYGHIGGEKQLQRLYPNPNSTPITFTGDALYNATTTTVFGADGMFDFEDNMFQIVQSSGNTYIYRNNLATSTATRFLEVTGTMPGNAQGLAYFGGNFYLATVSGTSIQIRRISLSDGAVSGVLATLTNSSSLSANLDLGSVDYFVPFTFNCGAASVTGLPFIQGVAATKTLNIPISNVYLPTAGRSYTINISGADFTSTSSTQTITAGQTSINVPITYNGTGTTGVKSTTTPQVVFANDDAKATPKGVFTTGTILGNDTTTGGGTLSFTGATSGATAITPGVQATIPGVGNLTINANGTYTFAPLATYVGTTAVSYTVCDSNAPQNCAPAVLYLTSLETSAYCYRAPNINAGITSPVKHGITALNRAGSATAAWPTVRQSAWTVLEAKTKGFVVNRMAFDGSGNPVGIPAANFIEGMMVYDTTNNCLKMYTSTNGGTSFAWYCMTTQACPN